MALIRIRFAHGTDREFAGHLHLEVDATGALLLKSDVRESQETPTVAYACANGVSGQWRSACLRKEKNRIENNAAPLLLYFYKTIPLRPAGEATRLLYQSMP